MNPERYLLTGASGFLGRCMHNYLQGRGEVVKAIGSGAGQLTIDITKPFSLPGEYAADTVIHAAGKAHSIPRNEKDEELFFKVNLEGTKNLCAALEKLSALPSAFIFISTVAVYGVDEGVMINEAHLLGGTGAYARSKIEAEQWLKEWTSKNNVTLSILRLPLIVGQDPPGNLGSLRHAIQKGRYLRIGRSDARKSIVWCRDVSAIVPVVKNIGGIFNLTDGTHPQFCDIENALMLQLKKKRIFSVPLPVAKVLALTGDVLGDKFPLNSTRLKKIISTLTFDDTKARERLGWTPSAAIEALKSNT